MADGDETIVAQVVVRHSGLHFNDVNVRIHGAAPNRRASFAAPHGAVRIADEIDLIVEGDVPRVIETTVVAHLPVAPGTVGDHFDARIDRES